MTYICDLPHSWLHAAWSLKVGSFCLVMHSKLDDLSLEDRTINAYWKARVIEIRKPMIQTKEQSVCDLNISFPQNLHSFQLATLFKS